AASTLLLRLTPGVERPAIGTMFPTAKEPVLVLDAGANVDCDARELVGFAHLGTVYARDVMGRPQPNVGLLNIGEEEETGSPEMAGVLKVLDYSTYGGAPLLGVQGVSIICHGSSPARAITNAIRVALKAVESHVAQDIGAEFAQGGAVA